MTGGVTRFGQVKFEVERGRLSVSGRPVALDRPCAAILATLLADPGKDVDKDRLLEAGWPGRVVHENSLAKAIGRLRQALGDDGRALVTVHGYGYRLEAEPIAEQADTRPAAIGLRRLGVGLAALASVVLAGLWLEPYLGAARTSEPAGLLRGEPADAIGRVLWVDDHPENNLAERRHLERNSIAVYQVTTSEEALALLAMYEYRAVISDMNRHDRPLAGLELVREMRRRADRTPFVLYTVVPSAAQRSLLDQAGGQHATVTPEELYAAVLPLVDKHAADPAP